MLSFTNSVETIYLSPYMLNRYIKIKLKCSGQNIKRKICLNAVCSLLKCQIYANLLFSLKFLQKRG